ncbi:hypothetical protein D3C72_1844690 [compost metagenome]
MQLHRNPVTRILRNFDDAVQQENARCLRPFRPEMRGYGGAEGKSAEHNRCRLAGDGRFRPLAQRPPTDPVLQRKAIVDRAGNLALIEIGRDHIVAQGPQPRRSVALKHPQSADGMKQDHCGHRFAPPVGCHRDT